MAVLRIPVMMLLHRRLDDRHGARLLIGLLAVASIGILALAIGPWIVLAVGGWTIRDIAREVLEPLSVAITNRHVESSVRATVISYRGKAEAVGEVMGGLLLGTLAQLTSVPWALMGSAVLHAVAALPFAASRVDAPSVASD
jgi:DHA3 family tetracycline resistance protein-like MFS transporter